MWAGCVKTDPPGNVKTVLMDAGSLPYPTADAARSLPFLPFQGPRPLLALIAEYCHGRMKYHHVNVLVLIRLFRSLFTH